jgi:hypothetical protein
MHIAGLGESRAISVVVTQIKDRWIKVGPDIRLVTDAMIRKRIQDLRKKYTDINRKVKRFGETEEAVAFRELLKKVFDTSHSEAAPKNPEDLAFLQNIRSVGNATLGPNNIVTEAFYERWAKEAETKQKQIEKKEARKLCEFIYRTLTKMELILFSLF